MRILLVRPRLIGDVILTTPAIRALRRRFPDAELVYLVEALAAPVVTANPHLTDVVVVEHSRGWNRLRDDMRVARALRARALPAGTDTGVPGHRRALDGEPVPQARELQRPDHRVGGRDEHDLDRGNGKAGHRGALQTGGKGRRGVQATTKWIGRAMGESRHNGHDISAMTGAPGRTAAGGRKTRVPPHWSATPIR